MLVSKFILTIRYYKWNNENGGHWFAGITGTADLDWNEGNPQSENILERNDKASTAYRADWRA